MNKLQKYHQASFKNLNSSILKHSLSSTFTHTQARLLTFMHSLIQLTSLPPKVYPILSTCHIVSLLTPSYNFYNSIMYIYLLGSYLNHKTAGSMRINAKEREKNEEKEREQGKWPKPPIPTRAVNVLIGAEEQNGKQKKTIMRETYSGTPTQLPCPIWSPLTTRKDRTVWPILKPPCPHGDILHWGTNFNF